MSGPRELREKAWSLIYEARDSKDPKRRRALIGQAFELLQQAGPQSQGKREEETKQRPKLEYYRICFLRNDRITLWVDLNVDNKADATWVAAALWDACAERNRGSLRARARDEFHLRQ